jgi:hypothetical protein
MQIEDPIFVDDPAILAQIAQLAAQYECTEEEAIGRAVSAELAIRRAGESTDAERQKPD